MENNSCNTLTEEEKLILRKQRFLSSSNVNTLESSKVSAIIFKFLLQILEEEKRKILERQKKFGVITELPEMEEEKKKQRLARFGSINENQVCINKFSYQM